MVERTSRHHPQRPRDVDAALAVVRVSARLAKVVRRLDDPLPNQRGVAMAELRHEERGEAGDECARDACTEALVDGKPALIREALAKSAAAGRGLGRC